MAYKGNDLDLRLPRSAPMREAAGPVESAGEGAWTQPTRAGPIAVDETVLAVCNCAHDVALFHASDAVRLEHLLHALTRVAASADILAELGIRVDQLRRETAVSLAAEMPAGPIERDSAPSASAALEDILRRAADLAARRRVAAGLHDLIRTLLAGGPGSPAATLLMQAAADPQRLERWRDEPRREALLSAQPAAGAEPRSSDLPSAVAETLREHLGRVEAAVRALREEAAADRKALGDLLRDLRPELQSLRLLRDDAAGDRKSIAELLASLRADLLSWRSEGGRAVGAVGTEAVEALLEARLGELGKATAALAERLPTIDKLAGGAVPQVRAHLEAAEERIGAQAIGAAERVAGSLAARLGETQAGLARLQEQTERHWAGGSERQIALEASVRAQLQVAEEASRAHERVLGEIHQALVKLGTNQQTLGDNFATWRSETGGDIGIVSNRLQQLEQTMLDLLGQLGGELQALRQESHDNGSRRGNGFKRWLYGTSSVFTTRRRDGVAPAPPDPERPPGDKAS